MCQRDSRAGSSAPTDSAARPEASVPSAATRTADGATKSGPNATTAVPAGAGLLLLSHYLMRVLDIGTEAIGYRLKDRVASVQVLNDTLSRIAAGEIVIEPMLAKRLAPSGRRGGAIESLSPREHEVLRLMAEGRTNAAIGAQLFLSSKTVEKHIAAIFARLGLPGEPTVYHRRVLAALAYWRVDG